jgi:hypothetical protein
MTPTLKEDFARCRDMLIAELVSLHTQRDQIDLKIHYLEAVMRITNAEEKVLIEKEEEKNGLQLQRDSPRPST